jgi:hypothetical protein
MAEKEEGEKMQKIIQWFWFLIKNLFKRKPKETEIEMPKMKFYREYKTTKRKRKLTRLSRKLNRGKNKGKTQRRHK